MSALDFFRNKKENKNNEKTQELSNESKQQSMVIKKLPPMIEHLLDKSTEDFFPVNGVWHSDCYQRPDTLNMNYINCHLRDEEWLSKMIRKTCPEAKFLTTDAVKRYILTSDTFAERRHNYELEVVRWQINWMRNGGDNWLVPNGYSTLSVFEKNHDKRFRGGIVRTLSKIGMDKEVIEEGIEKFADLWRKQEMETAFKSQFEPSLFSFTGKYDKLPEVEKQFKEAWFALRENEYYKDNKGSVDKYGKKTPAMCMQPKEINSTKEFVDQKIQERNEFLENFRHNNFTKKEDFNCIER